MLNRPETRDLLAEARQVLLDSLVPELGELEEVSRALAELADVVDAGGEVNPAWAGPFGEYVLPVIYTMLAHES